MKNKKIIILLPLCFLIYIIVVIAFNSSSISKKYIAFYNGVCWQYGTSWKNISQIELKKIDFNDSDIYNSGGFIDKLNLKYNDQWFINEKNDFKKYEEEFFTQYGFNKFNFIKYTSSNVNGYDMEKINNILSSNNLSTIKSMNELYYGSKVIIDYDNDNVDEYIYYISNMDTSIKANKYYSILFTVDEKNETTLLISTLNKIDSLNQINDNELYSIIDLDGDKKYDLIAQNEFYARSGKTTFYLFQLKNGIYKQVISNE